MVSKQGIQRQKSRFIASPKILVTLIIVLIALAFEFYYEGQLFGKISSRLLGDNGPEPEVRINPLSSNQGPKEPLAVKKIVWDSSKSILEYIKLHPDEPVVFSRTQADLWPARKLWRPKYLKQQMDSEKFVMKGAYLNNVPIFGPYYSKGKPMSGRGFEKVLRVNEHKVWSPTPTQFWNGIVNPKNDSYNYYSANIDVLPQSLLWDLDPIENILDLDPESNEQNINVWFGQSGVSAACHYDAYDNINVQVSGHKKWTLFNPSNHTQLYLFPFLHFHHAQTQVSMDSASNFTYDKSIELYPKYKDAVRYEVITGPGEALYLPSMWFHQVEALEASVNVNSWVKTNSNYVFQNIAAQLPFDDVVEVANTLYRDIDDKNLEKSSKHVANNVRMYLRELVKTLGKEELDQFIQSNIVLPRYQRLILSGQLEANGGSQDIDSYCIPQTIDSENMTKIQEAAQKHAKYIVEQVPKDTIDIWLANHIEFTYAISLQDVALAVGIINSCFR